MRRKIIKIDEEKCNGCAACANACHEGAIAMVNGKAKLIRDDYCDGMGDCLPECPTGAISFEEREAAAYDERAVAENRKKVQGMNTIHSHGCPGSQIIEMERNGQAAKDAGRWEQVSALRNWPVQIKLAPVKASYFDGAKLLIAADCTAYA
ncbi:MAG: 4Fe-4S binding protein, partial [Roseburia sp.]|nr:4Fe-4S binding protein [Roseburia sp.]